MNDLGLDTTTTLYEEEQRVTVKWMWWLVIAISASITIICLYGLYQQLILGEPFGTSPVSDNALMMTAPLVILLGLAPTLVIYFSRLIIRVDTETVRMNYRPFMRKRIALDAIEECTAQTFSPLRDHGGWGLRYSGKTRSHIYTVGGTTGIKIDLRNGMSMIIGSERAEDLAAVINRARGTE